MKKIRVWGFVIFMAAVLCACGEKQELIDMSTIENSDYTAIVWEDRTYVPFCVIPKSDCGAQIGYANGDKDDRVCEYGGYCQCRGWKSTPAAGRYTAGARRSA